MLNTISETVNQWRPWGTVKSVHWISFVILIRLQKMWNIWFLINECKWMTECCLHGELFQFSFYAAVSHTHPGQRRSDVSGATWKTTKHCWILWYAPKAYPQIFNQNCISNSSLTVTTGGYTRDECSKVINERKWTNLFSYWIFN